MDKIFHLIKPAWFFPVYSDKFPYTPTEKITHVMKQMEAIQSELPFGGLVFTGEVQGAMKYETTHAVRKETLSRRGPYRKGILKNGNKTSFT